MPVHMWNFFRAVGTGADLKCWNEDNPQVEDGREGGNQEFEDGVSDQYEDEVSHMMRRLRLNFYRAEDMLFIMRKKQWAIEDAEFAVEQKRRAKEKTERRIKKNRDRRLKKEKEEQKVEVEKKVVEAKEEKELQRSMASIFKCPLCDITMSPPRKIYQCIDGHILCQDCRRSEKIKDCPTCQGELAGRNPSMERIAVSVFSMEEEEPPVATLSAPTAPVAPKADKE